MSIKEKKFGSDVVAALDFIDELDRKAKKSKRRIIRRLHSRRRKEKWDKTLLISCKVDWSVTYEEVNGRHGRHRNSKRSQKSSLRF